MKKKWGMARRGVATAIVFVAGVPVAAAAAQDAAGNAFRGDEPAGTPFEVHFDAALNDGTPAPTVTVPESGFDGAECVEETGGVSLHSGSEVTAAQEQEGKCPKWVALDNFQKVDYGGGVGITMCRLTEEYTQKRGTSFLGGIVAGVKAIFGGEVKGEVKGWVESARTRCDYFGCGLDLSLSEAVWSTKN